MWWVFLGVCIMTTQNKYKRLAIAKSEFPSILKNAAAYGYKYAKLEQIIEAVEPILHKYDLDIMQKVVGKSVQTFLVDLVAGDLELVGDIEIDTAVQLAKMNSYQVFGSAISYYRRYEILAALNLAQEDDDAGGVDKSKHEQPKQPVVTTKAPRPEEQALIVAFNTKKQLVPAEHTATLTKLIANISTVSVAKLVEWTNWLNSLRPAVNDMQPNANN